MASAAPAASFKRLVVIDGPTPGLRQLITCPGSKSPAWADQSLKPANVLDEFKRHNDRVASADRSAAFIVSSARPVDAVDDQAAEPGVKGSRIARHPRH
jgi:hypothetical protein